MIRAVLPGSFDPITRGHEALVLRASDIFDEIIVAVAVGVHKRTIFTVEERAALVRRSFSRANIRVQSFDGLLADFMSDNDCRIILRGLRAVSDFEFESQLSHINKSLDGRLETLFFTPTQEFIHLSSTVVREVAELGGDVQKFVSPHVAAALQEKIKGR